LHPRTWNRSRVISRHTASTTRSYGSPARGDERTDTGTDRANDANAGRGTRYKAELVAEDVFAASFYFKDPDGIVLEYCAWLSAWDKVVRDHEPMTIADRVQAAPVS